MTDVNATLCQAQFDALVSFAYNVGSDNLKSSNLVAKLNQKPPDYVGAAGGFDGWHVPPEIIPRRDSEKALFESCMPGKCSTLAASADPNSLTADREGWIETTSTIGFDVTFENLANATASATDIRVILNVDPSFDLSSLQTIEVSHPDKLQNVTVNYAQRQVIWYFNNISLPPNVNPPDGQGWIWYSMKPYSNLTTNTVLTSQAQIIFDFNPPINTNIVQQKIDRDPPSSKIVLPGSDTTNSTLNVGWQGSDKGSGIANVLVFVSMDNQINYQLLDGLGNSSTTKTLFTGVPNHKYYFYTMAVDYAGNIESKSVADASISITQNSLGPLLVISGVALAAVAISVTYWRLRVRRRKGGLNRSRDT
jgi:hypothetical protein